MEDSKLSTDGIRSVYNIKYYTVRVSVELDEMCILKKDTRRRTVSGDLWSDVLGPYTKRLAFACYSPETIRFLSAYEGSV